jgi:hypothetical protein
MKRRVTKLLLLAICGGLAVTSSFGFAAAQDTNLALNNPDKFAWELFVQVNRSANTGSNNNVVWEEWAEQLYVYHDPNVAPVWPGPVNQPLVLRPSIKREALRQLQIERLNKQAQLLNGLDGASHPVSPQFIPSSPLSEEVRMNKASFDFIVSNNLWYRQGQIEAFKRGAPISFPIDAKEVKAHWKQIGEDEKPRYHWQTGADGKIYGLVAFHIMTKDVPNWFWATWEHVDNQDRCRENGCRDSFGLTADGQVSTALQTLFQGAGMGAEWQNYRLDGVQVDFTDSTGRPTIFGNSEIEAGFMKTSSCITCHSRATVDAFGGRLEIFTDDGQSYNGTPDPNWFYSNLTTSPPTPQYLQLDFVWSLMLARPRTQ